MWHAWEKREMQTVLWLGNLKGKRPPGRHSCRWETNIKTHFKEIGCEGVENDSSGSG